MVSRKPGELDEHINLIFINGVLFGKTQNHQHFFSSNWPLSDGHRWSLTTKKLGL